MVARISLLLAGCAALALLLTRGGHRDAKPADSAVLATDSSPSPTEVSSQTAEDAVNAARTPLGGTAADQGGAPAEPAASESRHVDLLVEVEFGDAPISAGTITLESDGVLLRTQEVKSKAAYLEGLDGGRDVTVTWWSGRPGLFRGRIHREPLALPDAGLASLSLETPFTNGSVGHVDLTVLLPVEMEIADLDLHIRPLDANHLTSSSLRDAPYERVQPGELQAQLLRLEAGTWSIDRPGVGSVGAFYVAPQATTTTVVDLRDLARVTVKVFAAGTERRIRGASVTVLQEESTDSVVEASAKFDAEGDFVVWTLPGAALLTAREPEGGSVTRQVEVPAEGGEFVVEMEVEVLLTHELRLVENGRPYDLELERWVEGDFVCLDGDGSIQRLQFTTVDPEVGYWASNVELLADAPGRYRWLLPADWPTDELWVDFDILETRSSATVVEVASNR